MTAEFESMAELLLVILTILCVVQLVLTGLLLWYLKRMADSIRIGAPAAAPPPGAAAAEAMPPAPREMPGAREAGEAVPVTPPAAPPAAPPAPPAPTTIELLDESPDIQGSIQRLSEKYRLKDFILATLDGLVVVSLYPGSSDEAARFSDLHRRKRKPDAPGVTFLELVHRTEPMLAILRAESPLTPDQVKGIEEDTRKILNWWL
ncbi:MAG: hypothetical protein LUO96_00585 [Methanomicrobiales archaeon]|nr:hypothetical protein [Methanomicrobiales archaeon]